MTVETFTNIIHKANGDGSTKDFNLSFSTYEADDVFVYLWDTSTDKYVLQSLTTHYTQSGSKISFVTAPPSPPSADFENIFIIRKTDLLNPKTTFQAGSSIRAADLNNNQRQIINAVQERLHLSPDILFPEFEGNLDMNGHKIKNIGVPVASTDVSTKAYVDTAIDSVTAAGASPPDSPSAGDRWYDTGTGRTYVYYTDTDSSAWVEASPPLHSGSGVDASSGNALPLAGGTMTGTLTLSGAPTANLHAASKAYVDAQNTGTTSVPLDGSSKMTGDLIMDNQKGVKFEEASGDNFVYLRGNNSLASDYTLTLPNAVPGANDYRLVSDTSGNLSWAAASALSGITNSSVANNAAINSEKLSFTAANTGAIARTVDAKLTELPSITDYGASTLSSASDNTTAIQNAFNAHRVLHVPAGVYQVDATLTVANKDFTIYGDGDGESVLEFTGGTDGIRWSANDGTTYFRAYDLQIRANGYRNGSPISASITPDQTTTARQSVILERVTATKLNASSSWICGFYFNNCSLGKANKLVFNGRKAGSSDSSYGIRITGNTTSGTGNDGEGSNQFFLSDSYVNNCEGPGYWIDGQSEHVTVENCVSWGNDIGVKIEGPNSATDGIKGNVTVKGCYLDDKDKGIYSTTSAHNKYLQNYITADFNNQTNTQEWIGIDIAGSNNNWTLISNNQFVGRGSANSTDIGVSINGVAQLLSENNHLYALDKGHKITDSACTHIQLNYNKHNIVGSSAVDYVDNTAGCTSLIQIYTEGNAGEDVLKVWNDNPTDNCQIQIGNGDTNSGKYMNMGALTDGIGQIETNNGLRLKTGTNAGTNIDVQCNGSNGLLDLHASGTTGIAKLRSSGTSGTTIVESTNGTSIKATNANANIDIDASGAGGNVKIQTSANDGQIEFWTNDAGGNANIQKATFTDEGLFLWRSASIPNTSEWPRHQIAGWGAPSIGCFNNQQNSTQRSQIIFYNGDSDNLPITSIVGTITSNNSSTVYNTSSDYRLKENVVGLTGAIARVKALTPYRFNFKVSPDVTVDGFMAHEAQTVVPEAVTGVKDGTSDIGTLKDKDGKVLRTNVGKPPELEFGKTWEKTGTTPAYQGIDQAKLVPLLTAALQEALTEIDTLKNRVTALEG